MGEPFQQPHAQALDCAEGIGGNSRGGGGAEGDQRTVGDGRAAVAVGPSHTVQVDAGVAAQAEQLAGPGLQR